jgi:hypothetical protein
VVMRAVSEVMLKSAARTAEATAERIGGHFTGGRFLVTVTADPASASVTPHIEGYDEASGNWFTILTGAAIEAVGSVMLTVAPYATAANNVAVAQRLPHRWRFRMAVADTDSMTYSVGAWLDPE